MADQGEISKLVEYYQQLYFTHDKPIPFTGHLMIYPVLVSDYYDFYSAVDVLKFEKNEDISGVGITMSHLDYLIYKMEQDNQEGYMITNQVIKIFELIFRIKNGIKCECDNHGDTFVPYQELFSQLSQLESEYQQSGQQLTPDVTMQILYKLKTCPKCQKIREDVIRFNVLTDNKKDIIVDGVEITDKDYDILRKLVLYYNIPDYNDEIIDPQLKAELELAAKLENPNNVTPTLEKQELCLAASTSYTLEEIEKMSLRHMVLLLRTVDAKLHYFTYRQAEAGGMVKFQGDLQHWIYSSDKPKSLLDRAMSLSGIKSKMAPVTGGQQ